MYKATNETIPTISYDTYKGITSEEEQELNTIIDNLLSHQQTKLLLEAIVLQLKALKHEKGITIKIVIQKNDEAKGHGGYCMNPCFFKQKDNSYKLYIYYSDLPKNGIYRPITFFLNGRYRMSYLEIPRYIAFAHESAHALNLLETIKNSLEKNLEELTNEQNSKNVLKYLSQKIPLEESLIKNSFENLDELSVILGSFHTTSLGLYFLGETVFLREHYKSISEQLHFWCWSHSLLEKKVLGPFEPNVESKFDYAIIHKLLSSLKFIEIKQKEQQDTITLSLGQAYRVPNVGGDGTEDKRDLIIVQQDGQFHNIDLSRLEKAETDITIETIEMTWGTSKRLIKKAKIPSKGDPVCVDEGQFCLFTLPSLEKQNLFFSKSGKDTVIYSENLYIDSIVLPLNVEKLTDKQSIFSLPKGAKIKDKEAVDLCIQPFIFKFKDRIIIEGSQAQLRDSTVVVTPCVDFPQTGTPLHFIEAEKTPHGGLETELATAGYRLQDVPNDGNCAFWAVSVANEVVTTEGMFSAKKGDPAYSEMIGLREKTAAEMEKSSSDIDASIIAMVRQQGSWNMGSMGGISLDVLGFVARVIGRPIMILSQEPNGQYRYWISGTTENPCDANLAFHDIEEKDLEKLLNSHLETVKLFHSNIHFQAIVKQ